jgi:D-alanine-D-alanine ligase
VSARIRVGVLLGGASSERQISLASGRMIAEHLPRDRYEVVLLDTLALMACNPRLSPELREKARGLLAGSGECVEEPGRDLPPELREQIRAAAAAAAPAGEARRAAAAAMPAVVKPVRQGSSIGMSLVGRPGQMRSALETAFAHDGRALVEERLSGTELTVGILGNRDAVPLPVVEIVPKREFFDYRAKYDPELCEELCPARIGPQATAGVQALALRAHHALGCRGFSRVDLMLTPAGPVVLEVNTLPGMTVNSLLPKAARAAGIPFPDLLDHLVRLALEPEE